MTSEIRVNKLQNRVGLGTVEFSDTGIVVSGIVTANSFSGPFAGDLDVDGHTNLDNVSVAGVSTFTGAIDANGDLDVDGHTELDNTNIVGMVTATNTSSGVGLKLIDASSKQFFAGGGGGGTPFVGSFTGHDFRIQVGGIQNAIFKYAAGATGNLELGPSSGIGITFNGSTGNAVYAGIITATTFKGDGDFVELDVDGHTNLDNVSIVGITTTTSNIEIKGNNKYLKLGASDQFAFVTAGAQSFITNSTGHLTSRSASYTWENYAGNTEYLRINSSGQMGLGTNNPNANFHIKSTFPAIRLEDDSDYSQIDANGGSLRLLADAGNASSNSSIQFQVDGTERLRIDSDGKIAMGLRSTSASNTCDPDGNQLLIRGASTFQTAKGHIMLTGDSATVGQGPQIVFSESGSGSNNAGAYIGHVRQGSNSIGDLVFGTRAISGDANTVPTERLRIRSDGEIVINHTQSSTPLNNTFISIWDANSDSSAIDASGISKNYAMISLHNYGTGVSGDTTGIGFGAGSAFSYTKGSIAFQRTGSYGTGDLVFLTNNDQNTTMVNDTDEKMRITRSGRVGIKNNLSDTFNSNANTLCIGDGGSAVGITFYTAASADGSHISFTETTGSTSEGMISYYQGSYSTTNDRDCMIFRANSSERFRITKHGVTQFRGGYTNSTNSNSTWITLFTFSDGNTHGFSMVCAVAENSYTTMYRVAGSPYWSSSYFTSDYAGDSGHAHSSDITFRILNDSGTKRLQFKAVSYTTTRQLTVISVWLKNGYAIWA